MESRADPEMTALADLCRSTAAALANGLPLDGSSLGGSYNFLRQLNWLDGRAELTPHRAAMLRAASTFRRLFTLEAPESPGLVVLGAEADPAVVGAEEASLAGVSGTGWTFGQAFESCVGEGVEYLSQFASADSDFMTCGPEEALRDASPPLLALWTRLAPSRVSPADARIDWVRGADLADGGTVFLPADLCYRRAAARRDVLIPWPLSIGCGAGENALDATVHGLLELIERDAVALWWWGGARARVISDGTGAAALARLRGGTTGRHTWLLDITSDIGVPTVAAASCTDDGFGLSCGHAARATLAAAAEAALMEMAQMEIGHRLAETKRAVRGEAALNEADWRHIRRFTRISVADTPALHPMAPPAPRRDIAENRQIDRLAAIRRRLDLVDLRPCAVNLTREVFGIAATRVVCPGLEPGGGEMVGPRLAAMAARNSVDPFRVPAL
jgi:ribosomal protein S12 methylthiotransferase accessory factor